MKQFNFQIPDELRDRLDRLRDRLSYRPNRSEFVRTLLAKGADRLEAELDEAARKPADEIER